MENVEYPFIIIIIIIIIIIPRTTLTWSGITY